MKKETKQLRLEMARDKFETKEGWAKEFFKLHPEAWGIFGGEMNQPKFKIGDYVQRSVNEDPFMITGIQWVECPRNNVKPPGTYAYLEDRWRMWHYENSLSLVRSKE